MSTEFMTFGAECESTQEIIGESTMKLKREYAVLILMALFFFASPLDAEDNKNYADCEVCHGGIHYGPEEAKEILGKECFDLFVLLADNQKTIKLDLDGVLKNGSGEKPDTGYELKIWGASPFFVKDLRDGSIILISNRVEDSSRALIFDNWKPEIYLYAAKSDNIDLEDSMDVAWEKMKTSAVYQWVISEGGGMEWEEVLKARMIKMLTLMTGQ
jgi:hypothetical protein